MASDVSGGRALAYYAERSSYAALPDDVRERAKMLVFDQLGCGYVGMELPTGQLGLEYVRAVGGHPRAGVVRSSLRTSAPWAAWMGGTAGHAAELDCAHATRDFRGTGHPAAAIVPAVLAVAEDQGRTGSDVINAVTLGFDAGARTVSLTGGLNRMRSEHGIYAGALHGVGAAIACARLLNLDAQRILFAAALAVGQTTPLTAFFTERHHMSKAITKGGQPAFAGASGALMAAAGLEACDNVFDTTGGIIDIWGEPGREHDVSHELGTEFAVSGANMKFYAAGYPIHSAVEAALTLMMSESIAPSDISAVEVGMPAFAGSVVDSRAMPTICMQDMLAVAIVAGGLGFDEAHSEELLGDQRVRRLRSVVTVVVDDELDTRQPNGRGSRVTLWTVRGQVSKLIEHPRGHRFRMPQPTWDDLREKWQALLTARMGADRFEELWSVCTRLEDLDDAGRLLPLLDE